MGTHVHRDGTHQIIVRDELERQADFVSQSQTMHIAT
jgi:hypothetical protein